MSDSCQLYSEQLSKAKKTISALENELHEVRLKVLKSNNNPDHLQEFKNITLEMSKVLNEIEIHQLNIDECKREKVVINN
jgi:hypothetical protein